MTEELLVCLKSRNWKVETDETNDNALPDELADRYINIPPQWYDFISGLKVLMSEDETTWFLCIKDFHEQGESAFRWNEWEKISLENGEIVYGCEPEFEECETVAGSFDEFVEKIVNGKILTAKPISAGVPWD